MPLWEISLRAQYDYPFIDLSREVPETPISMWCVWDRELLQVPASDPATLRRVEKAIRKAGRVVDQWVEADRTRLFVLRCTCSRYDSIWNVVEGAQCLDLPPVVYRDGWSYFRAVSLDEDRSRELFREFRGRGPAELLRKRELPMSVLPTSVWTHSLFGDLTEKQVDALAQAHRLGYYTSPRQITTEHIAKALGVSRSTYEEHLRKAENRIVAALMPYLELYTKGDHPASRLPLRAPPLAPEPAKAA